MSKLKKGFIYARVSTSLQVETGQGIDVQLKLCREFCKSESIQIEGEFTDEGISGSNEGDGELVSDIDRVGVSKYAGYP